MAIGWIALLKTVPWVDVIATAPAVADGAKKLWNAVARKPPPVQAPTEAKPSGLSLETEAVAQLQARLAALEKTASELHDQMLASSALIKELADQNTALIKRAEANRVRLFWLSGAVVFVGVLAVLGVALLLAR